jgi:hypothetical protein
LFGWAFQAATPLAISTDRIGHAARSGRHESAG